MKQMQLMAQVKKMQAEMAKAQDELANTVVTGTSGGGAVSIELTCDQRVKRVTLAKEAVDPEDVETLEDLITVALNDALAKSLETSQQRMASVTGGMRIPGLT
jgi:DNA-binding YbaB/EbfC family protein